MPKLLKPMTKNNKKYQLLIAIVVALVLIIFILFIAKHRTLTPQLGAVENDNIIKMKSGTSITKPSSWQASLFDNYIQVTSPENDLTVYFLELPAVDNLTTLANQAWQQVNPAFNLKVKQSSLFPAEDNWDKNSQVTYDTLVSDNRTVFAGIDIFNSTAYISLVDAKNAGFDRRKSELMIMLASLKPAGFKKVSLKDHATKTWTDSDIKDFDQFVTDSMQKLKVPGVSIAIIRKDGQTLYKKAFGVKQLGSTDQVTPDTLFMIGSITKQLTTLMMASLVDKRIFTWETPVVSILPNFKLADPELTKKIRLRDTVSASTGMPPNDMIWVFKYKGIKPEARLLEMQTVAPTTKVGEVFQYSNQLVMAGGYIAAHAYLPRVNLENAYNIAMQELVFNPLQMTRTVLKTKDAVKSGAALPHSTKINGDISVMPFNVEDRIYSLAPAGGVWSTTEDMSKDLLLELNKGLLNDKRIISEQSILERRKPGIKIFEDKSYGLCLEVGNWQGLKVIEHSGGTMGFASQLFFLPERGIGMIILTNSSGGDAFNHIVKQKFLELTFEAKPKAQAMLDLEIKITKESIENETKKISLNHKNLKWIEKLLGEYINPSLGKAKVLRNSHSTGYEIQFDEWKTQIGGETEDNGTKLLVVLDPPFAGMRFLVSEDRNKLILNSGQAQYVFIRAPI